MATSTSCMVSSLYPFIVQIVLLLSWNLLTLISAASFQLYFTEPPKPFVHLMLEINSNINYSISCRTNDPIASTTLFHQFQKLPVGGRISLDKHVYTIHGVVKKDGGYYMCQATRSQGDKPIEQSITLFISEEFVPCCPHILPLSNVVTAGTNTSFSCDVKMKKNSNTALGKYLHFKWYKKESGGVFVEIPDNDTNRHNESTSVLMIKNAKVTSEGGVHYHCKMSYRGRRMEESVDARLAVHDLSAAKIAFCNVDPESGVVNNSNDVKVHCKADGYPAPNITWLRNGIQMQVCVANADSSCAGIDYEVWERRNEAFAYAESYLTIKNTEYPKDHGQYTCMAKNSQQSDKKDVEISVQTLPTLDKTKKEWISTQQIFCKVTQTNPLPTFKWQYQSGLCLNNNPGCKPSDAKWQYITGYFVIFPAVDMATAISTLYLPEDAQSAFFRCVATNVLGTDYSVMNFFANGVDAISMETTSLEYYEDATLKLRCVMSWKGFMITWYKDGQQLTHNADARVNISWVAMSNQTWTELVMENIRANDSGLYTCGAQDDSGQNVNASNFIKINMLAGPIPGPPVEIALTQEIKIALSLGVVLFLSIFLAIAVCGIIRYQRMKRIKGYQSRFFAMYHGHHQIDPDRTLLEQCNNLPYDTDWEFPEDRLVLGEVLGSGAFGQVLKAEATGITDFNPRDKIVEKVPWRSKMLRRSGRSKRYHDSKGVPLMKTTVAVKTLKEGATVEEYKDLASELKILIHVGEHTNIVNLLGACTKGERLLVIMEYAPHGSLLKFLRGKRDIYEPIWAQTMNNPELGLNIANLMAYACQICRGMEFLASKKCIHRDLAARNVLVGEEYVMKIADFGLARDIYKSDLYVKTTSGVLPVKWMALESLFLKEYTEKSDIWSFGVCLWEIFTLGGTPYPGLPTERLLDFLSEGRRMQLPQNCPLEMYAIMIDCWQKEPGQRPTFAQLSERIGRILELRAAKRDSSTYISSTKDKNRGKNNYYLVPCDSGSTMPPGYERLSSEDLTHTPLSPLPRDTEHEGDLEPDERRRMLEPGASGSLSGNESGIELEEVGDDMAVAKTLRPVAFTTGKAKKKPKSEHTFV